MVAMLMAAGAWAVAVPGWGAESFDATFQETERLCEEYFLPNSMARPTGFDLEGRLRQLEAQLRERSAAFSAPGGVEYLRGKLGDATDDMSRACARQLLDYLAATPADSRSEPTSVCPRLAQCLSDLRGSERATVLSDCALVDVRGAVGSSRDAIRRSLGEPRWCRDAGAALELDHCGDKTTWGYSFYRIPGPGGGPELVLRFANDRIEIAEWLYTQ
jgi:hypothetical protein